MFYKSNPKLLSQFQFCEDQQVPLLAIIGDAELSQGEVKIRESKSRDEVGSIWLDVAMVVQVCLCWLGNGETSRSSQWDQA